VAATLACAALGPIACQPLFGLDGLTGGSCDAECDVQATSSDAGLGIDPDTSVSSIDAGGDEGPGNMLRDSGQAVSPDAGRAESGSPEAAPPDTGPTGIEAGSGCACIPAPPAGWIGPVAMWEGAGPSPGCTGDYSAQALDAFAALDAGPAECTCDCGELAGASCPSSFTATIFSDNGCATACDSVVVSAGVCVDVHGQCANVHGIAAAPQATGGSCAPKSSAAVPTASWGQSARACEAAVVPVQQGCNAGQICAPAPVAPMEPRLCAFKAGDVDCPGGGFTIRRTVYGGIADGRGCSSCACGTPSGVSCTGTVQEGCGQSGAVNQLPATCGGLSDPGSVTLVGNLVASGGSCAPSGGTPTGTAAPSSPTTVCCMP
jgi:hypothetical protein